MSNVIGNLLGNNAGKQAAAAAATQEANAQSDQGRQLALLSGSQAKTDQATAAMDGPNIGRAIMGFSRRTAGTLGG